eukprot:3385884-Rhodomonas_salina.2
MHADLALAFFPELDSGFARSSRGHALFGQEGSTGRRRGCCRGAPARGCAAASSLAPPAALTHTERGKQEGRSKRAAHQHSPLSTAQNQQQHATRCAGRDEARDRYRTRLVQLAPRCR